MKTPFFALLGAAAVSLAAPAHAFTDGECMSQQGRSLAEIETNLGPGRMTFAMAATRYSPASQHYQFGNYQTGTCSVSVSNGRADYVFYVSGWQ